MEADEKDTIKRKNTSGPTHAMKKVVKKSDRNQEATLDGSSELEVKEEDFLYDNHMVPLQSFERKLVLEE